MFKYLTPSEFEALSEYQQEKYLDEKRVHEAKEAAKAAAEAAKSVVAEEVKKAVEAVKEESNKALNDYKEEVKIQLDERDKKIENAKAEMNRIKGREDYEKIKSLSNEIHEFFSTEEGEGMLKNFATNKSKLNAELKNINVKAVGVMGVTAGTTRDGWIGPQAIQHEVVQARDIIPVSPTNSTLIKYVQFTKKEGNIGPVDAGSLKPQIDYNSNPVSTPVIKLAGWLTVQDEFLEDVEGARDFLASELPKAYMDEETRQAFKGTGTTATPDELSGLYSVWAQDLVLPKGVGANQVNTDSNSWDKIAAGLAQVRRNLRATDAIWISPEDFMELLINKDATDAYTYPIISDANGTPRMAGVPIFQHSVFQPGEGLAGDFRRGARFWQKKAMTIRTSTEHDENFTHNLTTILIEGRVALSCFFPEAFIKIDFTSTPVV